MDSRFCNGLSDLRQSFRCSPARIWGLQQVACFGTETGSVAACLPVCDTLSLVPCAQACPPPFPVLTQRPESQPRVRPCTDSPVRPHVLLAVTGFSRAAGCPTAPKAAPACSPGLVPSQARAWLATKRRFESQVITAPTYTVPGTVCVCLRGCSLSLGTEKQAGGGGGALGQKQLQGRPQAGGFGSLGSRAKGPWRQNGGETQTSCCCPPLPWLRVSRDPQGSGDRPVGEEGGVR